MSYKQFWYIVDEKDIEHSMLLDSYMGTHTHSTTPSYSELEVYEENLRRVEYISTGVNCYIIPFTYNFFEEMHGRTSLTALEMVTELQDAKWLHNVDQEIEAVGPSVSANCLTFNGVDEYGTGPHHASQNMGATFSFSGWAITDGSTGLCLLSKWGASGDYGFRFYIDGLRFKVIVSGNGTTYDNMSSFNNLTIDVWHHYVVTYNAGEYKFYVDGALDRTISGTTTSMFASTAGLELGTYNSGSQLFKGCVDEVVLFDKVLSLEEVVELYNEGAPISAISTSATDNCISSWRLETWNSGVMSDELGNCDLTLSNMIESDITARSV